MMDWKRGWPVRLAGIGLCVAVLAATAVAGSERARAATPVDEVRCLALTVYFEARGEPSLGQSAVAHVVMNRVADPHFPNSVCAVVHQGGDLHRFGCQFTWWCDGLSDRPRNLGKWFDALLTALDAYSGTSPDPTGGALWYHATYVAPPWRKHLARLVKIGQHIFYGEAQDVASRD